MLLPSTIPAVMDTASGQPDSAIESTSASVTRLLGKVSKSRIPKGPSTLVAVAASALPGPEAARPRSPTADDVAAADRAAVAAPRRVRASGLPTFAGSRRLPTETSPGASGPRLRSGSNSAAKGRQLENQLAVKRQRYTTLTRQLAEKEAQVRELCDDMAKLRGKVIAAGLKDPGGAESVAPGPERIERTALRALVGGTAAVDEQSPRYPESSAAMSEFVGTLERKLNEIMTANEEVCREALRKQTEVMGGLADSSRENEPKFGSGMTGRSESLEGEGAGLRSRLEEALSEHRAMIAELARQASALWVDRENRGVRANEPETSVGGLVGDLRERLRAALEELAAERERAARLQERRGAADAQLCKARSRIRELEGKTNGVETRLQQLQGTVKSLEGRNKEMHRVLRKSEGLVAVTEKQRDSLDSRVNELKRKIDSREAELNGVIDNLAKRLGNAENQLAAERELRCQAEEKAKELGERCAKLEVKCKQLYDLVRNTYGFASESDEMRTDSDTQLRAESQSARSALAAQGDELLQLRCEKEQTPDRINVKCVDDKLAVELAAKTEELRKVTAERAELQQDLKTALDKSDDFERQLSALRSGLQTYTRSKGGGKSGWDAHAIELQQQLCDLRTTLADLTRYNEELETSLSQKQLELEQRDRVMQEQSKVLKVRDELIGLLKEKNPNATGEPNESDGATLEGQTQLDQSTMPETINRLIAAKAEDLETLRRALQGKQMQLTRLEKMVRQMEDENERSQATRTKLEREVARLRLRLNENNRDQRSTGFIFM